MVSNIGVSTYSTLFLFLFDTSRLSEVTAEKVKFVSDEMNLADYLCPDALPENMFEVEQS